MVTGVRILLTCMLGGFVVIASEVMRIKRIISNESSRKILHIAHGLVVITWAYSVNYRFILAAEVLFLIVVLAARYFKALQPLRNVNRKSWGEIFFPIGIIIIALFNPSTGVFSIAILNLALADALAAIVGRRIKWGEYHVFGQRKTIAGSFTFFVVSALVLYYFVRFLLPGYSQTIVLVIPLIATIVENISPYGSDNLTIPVAVLGLLSICSPAIGL